MLLAVMDCDSYGITSFLPHCNLRANTKKNRGLIRSLLLTPFRFLVKLDFRAKIHRRPFFSFSMRCSGVGLGGADKQLVPADHSLPHVHRVQPDVGFSYQGLLHELSPIGHKEKLEVDQREKKVQLESDALKLNCKRGNYGVDKLWIMVHFQDSCVFHNKINPPKSDCLVIMKDTQKYENDRAFFLFVCFFC